MLGNITNKKYVIFSQKNKWRVLPRSKGKRRPRCVLPRLYMQCLVKLVTITTFDLAKYIQPKCRTTLYYTAELYLF